MTDRAALVERVAEAITRGDHGLKSGFIGIAVDLIRAEVLEDAAAEIERLRKMLWEVNEQCPEHVPVSLLNQIRAALKGK
jgi:hypothetical protein